MAQSDARFGYEASLSKQDHDLSHKFGFTCCPGMLCPIFYDEASPGDIYYIQHDLDFLRTAPLAAPAMVDVEIHYETFFVPIQMIYQPAEDTLYSLTNMFSSMFDRSYLQNNSFPLFDYSAYLDDVVDNGTQLEKQLAFRFADFMRLQALNFAAVDSLSYNSSFKYAPSFFPAQVLVYHSIYQYYYRLDDKSQFINASSNWDRFYNQTTPVQLSSVNHFFTIHHRPWDFDYFTSMYRSPIVSNVNLQSILPTVAGTPYNELTLDGTRPVDSAGVAPSVNEDYRAFTSQLSSSYNRDDLRKGFNTAAIRQMFANEKLAMITGRTKKNYDSQVLAHYGHRVPHDVKHDITLIGADHYKLRVGEVTSLASTYDPNTQTGSPLGELAGKGYASGAGRKHKFRVPTHGFVMTIFSIEPKKRYFGGFGRENAVVDAFDFPCPEFDRLGNIPMYRYETGSSNVLGQQFTDVIGWKERYYQWKRRPNRSSLAFMSPVPSLGVNNYAAYMLSSWAFGENGNTNYSRPDLESRFYISFDAMDDLMLINYDPGWIYDPSDPTGSENWNTHPWLVYARDPFIVDSYEKVKKVSFMSKDGEPIYPY